MPHFIVSFYALQPPLSIDATLLPPYQLSLLAYAPPRLVVCNLKFRISLAKVMDAVYIQRSLTI